MNLTSQRVATGLFAQATPAGSANTARAEIGDAKTSTAHPAANVIYAVRVTSGSGSDEAELTPSTGVCTAVTNSPEIEQSGTDFQGLDLPVSAIIHGLRLRTGAANSQRVSIRGPELGFLPSVDLPPGADLVIGWAAAGADLDPEGTMLFVFGATGDTILVELLGQTQ